MIAFLTCGVSLPGVAFELAPLVYDIIIIDSEYRTKKGKKIEQRMVFNDGIKASTNQAIKQSSNQSSRKDNGRHRRRPHHA
jgi:hypothetical protein